MLPVNLIRLEGQALPQRDLAPCRSVGTRGQTIHTPFRHELSLRAMAPDLFAALLRPDVLGILLTSKCNISCRHCCNNSAPTQDATRTRSQVKGILASARELPSVREVGLSGGEPFMQLPLLRSVLRMCAERGYSVSVTTNGFWARSSATAGRLLNLLRLDGLCALNLSTSAFHREHLDARVVPQAARAALDAGMRPVINVVTTRGYGLSDVKRELGDEIAVRVDFVVMPCLPAGRATASIAAGEYVQDQAQPLGNCEHDFKKLAIDQRGDVYPCCSPGGFTAPLKLGNIDELPVLSAPQVQARHRLLAILHSVGPSFFLPFVRRAFPQDRALDTFSDKCHLCHVLMSTPRYTDIVHDAGGVLFQSLESGGDPPLASRPSEKGGFSTGSTPMPVAVVLSS